MIAHKSPISGVAAYKNQYVATAGYDNQVILWDSNHKTALARGLHDHLANQVAFSPDGKFLISSSSDHTARIWSIPDMKLKAVFSEHLDDVEMSMFHPTEELVATASRDHCIRIYDFQGNLKARFEGHTADVISVAWSISGDEVISSSDDGTIKRWELATGTLIDDMDLGGVETDTIAIAPDGTIFAGNDEGEIIIVREGNTTACHAHSSGIKRLVHHENKNLLVSLSYDRKVRVWSTQSAEIQPVASSILPSEVWPRSCAFLDETTLVFATFGSSYATYFIESDSWDLAGVHPTQGINAVSIHDGKRLTIGDSGILHIENKKATEVGSLCNFLTSAGGRVLTGGQLGCVTDALSGESIHQHRSPLNCGVMFTRNDTPHIIIGTYTGEGLVFSVAPDGDVKHVLTLPLHTNAVKSISVSDGLIFSVCADTSAAWFSIENLSELTRVGKAHDRIANGCASLPDGRFLSVGRDRKLRIWSKDQSVIVDAPLNRSIKCVSASSNGRYAAAGSYSGEVALYDIHSHEWIRTVRPTTAGISSVFFDAANDCFLASSYDGQVYEILAGHA